MGIKVAKNVFFGNTYGDNELNLNEWFYLVFVRAGGDCKIYINGELDKVDYEGCVFAPNNIQDRDMGLKIGDDYNGLSYVDELAIWGRALSDDEIFTHYNNIA